MADVTLRIDGSVVVFTPQTAAAREWTDENVEVPSWAWMGEGFACEARMAADLEQGYLAAGFDVEVV